VGNKRAYPPSGSGGSLRANSQMTDKEWAAACEAAAKHGYTIGEWLQLSQAQKRHCRKELARCLKAGVAYVPQRVERVYSAQEREAYRASQAAT